MEPVQLVLSVIGLAITVAIPWAVHRVSNPQRRVSFFLQRHMPAPGTEAEWVTLSMWSSGRADIPSSAFDADRPIVFHFDVPIIDEGPKDELLDLGGLRVEPPHRLVFDPALIGRGTVFHRQVVVAGPARVRVRHPLTDIEVVASRVPPDAARTARRSRTLLRNGLFWGVVLFVTGYVIAGAARFAVTLDEPMRDALYSLAGTLLIAGAITVLMTLLVRLVRLLAARSQTRRARASHAPQ